jgi:conjugal transfer/entry exclusion protein
MPAMRRVILSIAKLVTKIFYGSQVSDPHNGYRVISLSALRKFVITADGMHYANEINEQIQSHQMDYEEIPVHIRYTEYSLGK